MQTEFESATENAALKAAIINRIRREGGISFRDFMQMALYEPEPRLLLHRPRDDGPERRLPDEPGGQPTVRRDGWPRSCVRCGSSRPAVRASISSK